MLQRVGKTNDAKTAHWTAWTCVLAPGAVTDPTIPLRLAEQALQSDPESTFQRQTLGAALYRAGRFQEALAPQTDLAAHWDRNGVTDQDRTSPAYTYFLLAMTHHRLGNATEAQEWLDKGIHWVEQKPPAWNRRITLKRFCSEAEDLLGIPAVAPKPEEKKPEVGNQ